MPRIHVKPPAKNCAEFGKDASELVKAYGFTLDPWQELVLNDWLSVDNTFHFINETCGLSVPRQNGKNALIEARELYGLVTVGEKFLHTAHEVKTARKAFIRLSSFFENEKQYPELSDMVASIRKTNGQEAIELTNGGSVEFSARSRSAARGYTVDTVIFDEAQELTDEQSEAIIPTLSAAPSGNRQFIYTGTPPPPTSPGTVFFNIRKSALENKGGVNWCEWSVEKPIKQTITWQEVKPLVLSVNPATGYRIDIDFLQHEFNALSRDGFSRERLGWWSDVQDVNKPLITKNLWTKGKIEPEEVPQNGIRNIGIKFAYDNKHAALCCGVKIPEANKVYVELLKIYDLEFGLSQIANDILDKKDKIGSIAIDGLGSQYTLQETLLDNGLNHRSILRTGTRDLATATNMLFDGVKAKTLLHAESPALDNAALTSTKREIGKNGAWGWDGEDSFILEAASMAVFAAKFNKRIPGKKMVIKCR